MVTKKRKLDVSSLLSTPVFKGKRFCSSWYDIPEFSEWLAESTVPNKAYCKFCRKDLIAGKSELFKHVKSQKHCRRAKELLDEVTLWTQIYSSL